MVFRTCRGPVQFKLQIGDGDGVGVTDGTWLVGSGVGVGVGIGGMAVVDVVFS